MKQKFKEAYMKTAEVFAELSYAKRLHVGAIIVKDDRIISIGYNGMPAGWDNNCEERQWMDSDAGGWLDVDEIMDRWPYEEYSDVEPTALIGRYNLKSKPEVLHAEMNSLMKLAKSTESGNQASIFVTHSPCLECAKGIYQAGIKEVFYKHRYRSDSGIEFLKKCNIPVEQIDYVK